MKLGYACVGTLLLAILPNMRGIVQRRATTAAEKAAALEGGWLPSLDEGMALARKTGKPLMVVLRCVP